MASSFDFNQKEKKVLFVGSADHPGITSNHCRAVIASFFWQSQVITTTAGVKNDQAVAIAQRPLNRSELFELIQPENWVRSRKRTNVANMRRDIPNHEAIIQQNGKIEEREFRNKKVPGIVCHIYSAGDELLRFTAFKDGE